jgi:hypothetical protein
VAVLRIAAERFQETKVVVIVPRRLWIGSLVSPSISSEGCCVNVLQVERIENRLIRAAVGGVAHHPVNLELSATIIAGVTA